MLNNIYCVPDEKDPQKHVYIVYFQVRKFREEKKKDFLQLKQL